MSSARKAIFYFLFILVLNLPLFLIHTPQVLAQAPATAPAPAALAPANSEPWTGPRQVNFSFLSIFSSIFCTIIGWTPITGEKCVTYATDSSDPNKAKPYVASILPNGGAIGGLSTLIATLFVHPVLSDTLYLADLGSNLGIVDTAYAQSVTGSGNDVIKAVLALWKVSRNLAYLMFILVFVIVGFMIMLRHKINPQTVISVQAALPKLVIGLILVTFSYFIAALIVDFTFVGMQIVALFFKNSGLSGVQNASDIATTGNIFSLYGQYLFSLTIWTNVIPGVAKLFYSTLTPSTGVGVGAVAGGVLASVILGPLGIIALVGSLLFATGAAQLILGGIIGILLGVIILIALFIQILKLLWYLVNAYIAIFIYTVAGPILIAAGSIPGREAVITMWWKTLLANVLVFPAVFAAFLFASVFLSNSVSIDKQTLPLFAGMDVTLLQTIIGFGILLGMPAIPGMVKKAMKVEDFGAISQAALGGLAAGVAVPRAGINKAYEPIRIQRQALQEAANREYYAKLAQATGGNLRKQGVLPWFSTAGLSLPGGGGGGRGLWGRMFRGSDQVIAAHQAQQAATQPQPPTPPGPTGGGQPPTQPPTPGGTTGGGTGGQGGQGGGGGTP